MWCEPQAIFKKYAYLLLAGCPAFSIWLFLKDVEISALISDYLLKIFITLQKLVFIALSRDNFALGKIETLYHKSLFVTKSFDSV